MYVLLVLLAYLFLSVIRTATGPSVWDRFLGLNLVSTKIVMSLVVFASVTDTSYFLDYAIICALFGFISVIFIALFLLDRAKGR